MTLSRILKEPLLHFLVLGACLFVLFAWVNREAMNAPDEIVVDESRIEGLAKRFEQLWLRPPTDAQLRGLIESWVREEILYREGIALGLDRNDTIIRRRIAQKVEFMADGVVPSEPTEAELEDWLRSNMARYRSEPEYSFQQVYFDPSRHGDDLREWLGALSQSLSEGVPLPEGDTTSLPGIVKSWSARDIARTFGSAFTETLAHLPVGVWQGPVESGFGMHLIRIDENVPAREPELAAVRTRVEADWLAAQSERVNEAFYQALRQRYTVRIEGAMTVAANPSRVSGR